MFYWLFFAKLKVFDLKNCGEIFKFCKKKCKQNQKFELQIKDVALIAKQLFYFHR